MTTPLASVVLNVGDDVASPGGAPPREKASSTSARRGSFHRSDEPPLDDAKFASRVPRCPPRVGRLWDTMLDPTRVSRRSSHFTASNAFQGKQFDYRSWSDTVFVTRARAVNNFKWPWALCVAVSVVWCALARNVDALDWDLTAFERAYALIFSLLAFMLVFRLNRAAIRFWDCRAAWGAIVMRGRNLCDDAVVALADVAPHECEEILRWFAAFAVAVKCHLRRDERIPAIELDGVLTEEEVDEMTRRATHWPLFCARRMRAAVGVATLATDAGDASHGDGRGAWIVGARGGAGSTRRHRASDDDVASTRSVGQNVGQRVGQDRRRRLHPILAGEVYTRLNFQIDELVDKCGVQERVRATRLPIVYVTHLRTFLMGYLVSLPFVFQKFWGWGTPVAVACVAFALLGVEGAATECENPFSRRRTNHLGMDGFAMQIINETAQYLRLWREDCEEEEEEEEEERADEGGEASGG